MDLVSQTPPFTTVHFDEGTYVLGRTSLKLNDICLSRNHCTLTVHSDIPPCLTPQHVNPLYVTRDNVAIRCDGPVILRHDDVISFLEPSLYQFRVVISAENNIRQKIVDHKSLRIVGDKIEECVLVVDSNVEEDVHLAGLAVFPGSLPLSSADIYAAASVSANVIESVTGKRCTPSSAAVHIISRSSDDLNKASDERTSNFSCQNGGGDRDEEGEVAMVVGQVGLCSPRVAVPATPAQPKRKAVQAAAKVARKKEKTTPLMSEIAIELVLVRYYLSVGQTLARLKRIIRQRKACGNRTALQLAALTQTGTRTDLATRLARDDIAVLSTTALCTHVAEIEQADDDATAKEAQERQRRRPWIAKIPANIEVRLHRALRERLFLLQRHPQQGDVSPSVKFEVLGSTGNVYTVVVAEIPSCSCPDSSVPCKHLLFVYLRVLRLPAESPLLYQVALVPTELIEMFALAPADSGRHVMASDIVLQTFLHGAAPNVPGQSRSGVTRRAVDTTEDCSICFEPFGTERLVWCEVQCGNSLHAACMAMIVGHSDRNARCPLCRAPWADSGAEQSKGQSDERYRNLAAISGHSPREEYVPEWRRRYY